MEKSFFKHLLMLCLFGTISMGASAEVYSGSCGDNAQWSLDTGTGVLSITGSGNMTNFNNSGAPWYSYSSSISSLSIGDQITSIGEFAFQGCSGLNSVTIPKSVTSIGTYSFMSCNNVKELIYAEGTKTVLPTRLKSITTVTIPNSVTSIGSYAFNSFSNLTSVEIPNSVTSIGNYAFEYCSGLTSVEIPNSVTSIGSYAFEGCSGLTSVTIPESVTEIGERAFSDCSGLTSVEIPNSVTSIGNYAFANCSNVTKLIYAEGTKKVLRTYLTSITSVEIPNSVTEIGERAFYGCTKLTSIEIPNSVTSIGSYAFYNCSGLTSIEIPNSVTKIGEKAFYGCTKLTSIIADGVNAPTIGSNCFNNVKNCTLHVPSDSEDSYASNFGEYFGESNSYGNTIAPYSSYSKSSGEYSFGTWNASSDVVLGEGIEKVYVPVEATVGSLQYKRTFNNTDWQALYVPFELDVKNDLADFSVYEISTSSADAINVTLITEGTTSANTAYLMKAKATGEQTIPVSSKTVKVTVENTNSELSDFEIVGTYAKLNYGDISGDWYALKGGKFMKAGEGAYLNPYRFYLKRKVSSAKESIDININEPTGITLYENPSHRQAQGKLGSGQAQNENGVIYNLNGMRVDSNYKGIVIINGKKYLKK